MFVHELHALFLAGWHKRSIIKQASVSFALVHAQLSNLINLLVLARWRLKNCWEIVWEEMINYMSSHTRLQLLLY